MIKILHTADWHLGKRLERFSRLEEQRQVLNELVELAQQHQVDMVVVAGDLYDAFNPPTEAQQLLYDTLKRLARGGQCAVVAIAGNHDSPDQVVAPELLAQENGIIFCGLPDHVVPPFEVPGGFKVLQSQPGFVELALPGHAFPVRLLLTPYANEFRMQRFLGFENKEEALRQALQAHWQQLATQYCNEQGVNLLATHGYWVERQGERPEEPEGEKSILHVGGAQALFTDALPAQIQYTALGHLHGYKVLQGAAGPCVYAGSPLAYSFAEAGQTKFAVLVKLAPGQAAQLTPLPLHSGRPLKRQTCTEVPAAMEWLAQHPNYLVELTVKTQNYMSAAEQRQLFAAHNGIVNLLPHVANPGATSAANTPTIDLSQSVPQLFANYFKHKHGTLPNEALQNLLQEVLQVSPDNPENA